MVRCMNRYRDAVIVIVRKRDSIAVEPFIHAHESNHFGRIIFRGTLTGFLKGTRQDVMAAIVTTPFQMGRAGEAICIWVVRKPRSLSVFEKLDGGPMPPDFHVVAMDVRALDQQ